ncbi:hypothetical protein K466DRAFT_566185 [Polyporus arcularius HHB13444]|uniref:Uncharacterized protein n=1 Tax=Polyporus arcularius HHB13444 TaxID=1314778 RepID=A0A5C3P8X9_9APHY|nr:hypothetical protein K466DRAFT_566185 [Polyporus arcularius HHB13444]
MDTVTGSTQTPILAITKVGSETILSYHEAVEGEEKEKKNKENKEEDEKEEREREREREEGEGEEACSVNRLITDSSDSCPPRELEDVVRERVMTEIERRAQGEREWWFINVPNE